MEQMNSYYDALLQTVGSIRPENIGTCRGDRDHAFNYQPETQQGALIKAQPFSFNLGLESRGHVWDWKAVGDCKPQQCSRSECMVCLPHRIWS